MSSHFPSHIPPWSSYSQPDFGNKDSLDSNTSPPISPTSPSHSFSSRHDNPFFSPRPQRGSLLVVADALGFKFGRRRKSIRQPPMPIILPDVIEISASRTDNEAEERARFRTEAAQALGFVQDGQQKEDEKEKEEEATETNKTTNEILSESAPISTTTSLPLRGRGRSGSMPVFASTHSPVPRFPTTPAALASLKQTSSTLPKYYPPASLRLFTLTKYWKSRFIVLSSPTGLVQQTRPSVSYLHLFKTSALDERELERLEINEESVVFVAEEEVGGRKHVIKVGGVDVGALRKEFNHVESGRTMWFLQTTDQAEAQKWISAIKGAIFSQRTVRAGLGLPGSTYGAVEPRGDMDVMLSMRAQGIITTPTQAATSTISRSHLEPTAVSPTPSLRSQGKSSVAVSTLKGLFVGGARPRVTSNTSRATSIDTERDRRNLNEDTASFTSIGNNLLGIKRPATADPISGVVRSPLLPASHYRLERKIVPDHQAFSDEQSRLHRANKTLSVVIGGGNRQLQPAPRKRWTTTGPSMLPELDDEMYQQVDGNRSDTFAPLQHNRSNTEPPPSPRFNNGFSFETPEHKQRAPSMTSVSTFASGGDGPNGEPLSASSTSTKRSSARFSRQLPQRLTPPAGPPPAAPGASARHPYASLDRPPSRTDSTRSGRSSRSIVSSLPSFSKRASASSGLSSTTTSTSHSQNSNILNGAASISRHASHRTSLPPPQRPAPTFAIPAAPGSQIQDSQLPTPPPSTKRDSIAHRTFRLSLSAPKPPPSTLLPPRPDESGYHRRSHSSGKRELFSIPQSPAAPSPNGIPTVSPPSPPPIRPLPPTPESLAPPSPPSRHTSFKQRFRNLSAPPTPQLSATTPLTPTTAPSPAPVAHLTHKPQRSHPGNITVSPFSHSSFLSTSNSPPGTPIAEKITEYSEDSFLQMYSPATPFQTPKMQVVSASWIEKEYEAPPLSPPPRRSSKQMSFFDNLKEPNPEERDTSKPAVTNGNKTEDGGATPVIPPLDKPISLSHHDSVISLGIVSV